jgi:hypothetical protein
MKSILFSFDYELFLGSNSGSVNECLIQPTKKLLKILKAYNVSGIFFVDTIYLLRLKEQSAISPIAAKDFNNIVNQLRELKQAGGYLFTHLHPHWIDARYEEATNTWSLTDKSKYRFSVLNESDRQHYFGASIKLLAEILNTEDASMLNAYRAGGWSITPFSDFKECFLQNKIRYDFTVIPGKYLVSDAQRFDFRGAPEKIKYSFNDDICKEEPGGRFIQFPVSVYTESPLISKLSGIYEKIKHAVFSRISIEKEKGKTVVTKVEVSEDAFCQRGRKKLVAQFENLNLFNFISILIYFRKTKHLHTVSHPKMFKTWDFIYMRAFLFLTSIGGPLISDFHLLDEML